MARPSGKLFDQVEACPTGEILDRLNLPASAVDKDANQEPPDNADNLQNVQDAPDALDTDT